MKKIIIALLLVFSSLVITMAYTQDEKDAATFLAARGIIKEQKDISLYQLDSTITRGEVMKIIGKLSGEKIDDKCDGIFPDVDESGWACKYIEFAYEKEFIAKNKIFRPNELITKTESIKLLLKVKGIDKTQKTEKWQEDYMITAYQNGFINEKYLDYNTNALRGWIFSIAHSIVDKEEIKNGVRYLISGEVKIDDEALNHYEENDEIYIEAETGKLSGAGEYSKLGESSRGNEAYLGDGGATVSYEFNLSKADSYELFIRLNDDGKHSDGTRSTTIKINSKTIYYNHISENIEKWKWFSLGKVTLNQGKNSISFEKNTTTSAAFIMDAFKLVPGELSYDEENENIEPVVGTPEFLKLHPMCTQSFRDEIKESREFNSKIDLTAASQEVHHSTIGYEPCSSEEQSCFDDVKGDYLGEGKYAPCYIGTSCYTEFKTKLIKCANDSMDCKEKAFCGFITK